MLALQRMMKLSRNLRNALLIGQPALLLALSGCASSGSVSSTPAATSSTVIRQPSARPVREPTIHMEPGLERVIGATRGQLTSQFGDPRLDVWEGDARKLQFTGSACVLDVFLYPTSRSHEPIATFVNARRTSDGNDVDKAACVQALRR